MALLCLQGLLWDWYKELKVQGFTLDANGYTTSFRQAPLLPPSLPLLVFVTLHPVFVKGATSHSCLDCHSQLWALADPGQLRCLALCSLVAPVRQMREKCTVCRSPRWQTSPSCSCAIQGSRKKRQELGGAAGGHRGQAGCPDLHVQHWRCRLLSQHVRQGASCKVGKHLPANSLGLRLATLVLAEGRTGARKSGPAVGPLKGSTTSHHTEPVVNWGGGGDEVQGRTAVGIG